MKKLFVFCLTVALSITACHESDNSKDNEPAYTPGFTIAPDSIVIRESGTPEVLKVTLLEIPDPVVTIHASMTDNTEFTITPESTSLTHLNWTQGATFSINPLDDGIRDGVQTVEITFKVTSPSLEWNLLPAKKILAIVHDDGIVNFIDCTKTPDDPSCPKQIDCEKTPDDPSCQKQVDCEKTPDDPSCPQTIVTCDETYSGTKIRFMAANTTSGNNQTYDDGKGIRMFQAMKPDVVLIQEFNYHDDTDSDFQEMLKTSFGEGYHYYRGTGNIPNGIISRYPILSTGSWKSNITNNRAWEWAVIDIPGDRDLLAVSVHLHSDKNGSELKPLHEKIQTKQKEGNYFVVLGGDFNARGRGGVSSNMGGVFAVHNYTKNSCADTKYPVDQDGNSCTSAERDDPYDWVLFDKTMDTYEVPVSIGSHCYSYGHVLDSRVYAAHDELGDIPPVKETDSWKYETSPLENDQSTINNFQHMPVIRDIVIPQ